MKVQLSEIESKMTNALSKKGYAKDDIPFIINMYLGGELRGHISHGLVAFPGFMQRDLSGLPEPEVIKSTNAFLLLNAKSNSGTVIGRHAADEAIKRASNETAGIVTIKNMDSWPRPGGVAEYIAYQGFMAVVVNNTGVYTAPPGGYDPVTGTNPIAYGIPTNEGSLVVDMATSKRARGEVRLANKYGTDLPDDTFYDNDGNITLDPKKAWSVMPSGDYKGFAMAFLVEVMCGSLVGMDMMIDGSAGNNLGEKTPERGALILAINPAQTVGVDVFKQANSEFIQKIKATRPRKNEQIRIPGEQAMAEKAAKLKEGAVEISEELWEEIKSLAGENNA